jgi:hypothetical protein
MAKLITRAIYPTNLSEINTNPLTTRDVEKYFNNYFDIPINVSSNVDSAIVAYFEQITSNKESAKALASAVIYTSLKQGLDPMITLKEFQKLSAGELDAYTAMFLNFERVGTSYLGINNTPQLNKYIQRTIIS